VFGCAYVSTGSQVIDVADLAASASVEDFENGDIRNIFRELLCVYPPPTTTPIVVAFPVVCVVVAVCVVVVLWWWCGGGGNLFGLLCGVLLLC
jgi:hypothetical protein